MKTFDAFMTERGFTTCGMARLTGFTKSQISEYRRGLHKPSRRSAQRIANALRLPLGAVLAQIDVREQCENKVKPAVYCRLCHRQFYRVPSNAALFDGGEHTGKTAQAA